MMDEGSVHTSLTLSTEHDSIYTYNITTEHCLAGGPQCCPYPDHFLGTNADRCKAHLAPFSLLFWKCHLKAGVPVDATPFKEPVLLKRGKYVLAY